MTSDTSKKTLRPEIKWDDDGDFDFEQDAKKGAVEDSAFAKLVDEADAHETRVRIGEKVKGVVSIVPASGEILIDLGASKLTGMIDRREFQNEAGELTLKVGDQIEAFVVGKKGGEVHLSHKMSQSVRTLDDLLSAKDQKVPVRGKVLSVNKGGFEVAVLGKTAFCPLSQIDLKFTENGADHIGKEYEFLVEKVEEKGRNIVLSRVALLRAKAEERLKELSTAVGTDTIFDGTVTQLRDFGAFIDIGGVEGMAHISELGFGRVAKASDVLNIGDQVKVKILKLDRDEKGRPKLGLSLKGALTDPWDDIYKHIEGGRSYVGKVVKLMPFGAFVEIKPGVEGLLHISELSWTKRVHHPSEVVKEGESITVAVKDIDTAHRRIALSLKKVEEDPWFGAETTYQVKSEHVGKVDKLKPFGIFIELAPGVTGLLPMSAVKRAFGDAYRSATSPGKDLKVRVVSLDLEGRKLQLTLAELEDDEAGDKDYQAYLADEQAARRKDESVPRRGSLGDLLQAKLGQKA